MLPVPLGRQDGPGDQESHDQGYKAAYDDQCDHGRDYYLAAPYMQYASTRICIRS